MNNNEISLLSLLKFRTVAVPTSSGKSIPRARVIWAHTQVIQRIHVFCGVTPCYWVIAHRRSEEPQWSSHPTVKESNKNFFCDASTISLWLGPSRRRYYGPFKTSGEPLTQWHNVKHQKIRTPPPIWYNKPWIRRQYDISKRRLNTMRSQSHCALGLRYAELVVSIVVTVEVCCCFTVFSC
jgi:hypothetical protein